MSNLFPFLQPEAVEIDDNLPLYKETAWDYEHDIPIWKNGKPVIVTGAEAVKVWCWNALHVPRKRHMIYSWMYGHDIENLMGQTYTDDVKQSEAIRYVRECLQINPYVTDVAQISVDFEDDTIKIDCTVNTIYGEVEISV
ncbi:MAG: DUF2634 domain-containing protein [Ruminococcaceae bacterium]|jgi:hypothetical protein|nr:DUF2634 domain-containing protein [Oscillospiraceae bacterium]